MTPSSPGLEVFFLEPVRGDAGWGAGSAFFAFRNTGLREAARAALTSQASLGAAIPGGGDAAASCASFLEVLQEIVLGLRFTSHK